MSELNITFRIESKDSKQSFEVVGEEKNNRIIFVDPEENTNYIIFHKASIEYYKRGSVDMKYKFTLHEKTKGIYKVYGNQFDFDIVTDKLIVRDERIYIKYRLIQNDELVNDTVLELKYNPKKEASSCKVKNH